MKAAGLCNWCLLSLHFLPSLLFYYSPLCIFSLSQLNVVLAWLFLASSENLFFYYCFFVFFCVHPLFSQKACRLFHNLRTYLTSPPNISVAIFSFFFLSSFYNSSHALNGVGFLFFSFVPYFLFLFFFCIFLSLSLSFGLHILGWLEVVWRVRRREKKMKKNFMGDVN